MALSERPGSPKSVWGPFLTTGLQAQTSGRGAECPIAATPGAAGPRLTLSSCFSPGSSWAAWAAWTSRHTGASGKCHMPSLGALGGSLARVFLPIEAQVAMSAQALPRPSPPPTFHSGHGGSVGSWGCSVDPHGPGQQWPPGAPEDHLPELTCGRDSACAFPFRQGHPAVGMLTHQHRQLDAPCQGGAGLPILGGGSEDSWAGLQGLM